MSKNFGGVQPKMRDSVIESQGFLGPYWDESYKLQVGASQSMVFNEGSAGPFYFSNKERELRKYDRPTGKTSVVKIK